MKKIVFTLSFLLLSSFSLLAQKYTWPETAEIIVGILEESIEDTETGLEAVGGGEVDVYAVEGENAIEHVIIVNKASLINSLTDTELKKRRDGSAEELIQALISDYGEGSLNAVINSIAANDGELRLIFAYEGGATPLFKEISITSDDMKRIYKDMAVKVNASPAGHSYVANANGMKITLDFSDSSVKAIYNDGRRESLLTYSWYKEGKYVIMSDDGAPLEISANAQTLTDTSNGVVFKMKK